MTDRTFAYNEEPQINAGYLHFYTDGPKSHAKTVACGETVNIDLNADGTVVGIELLDLETPLAQFIRTALGADED